jgi:hypothetical protein
VAEAERVRREVLRAAEEKAAEARARRETIAHEARRLAERAEAAAREVARSIEAQERARADQARWAERLAAAEEAGRRAEARHAEAGEAARWLAELAAHATQREMEARRAEKAALAEVYRKTIEARPAADTRRTPAAEDTPHLAPVQTDEPDITVVIPEAETPTRPSPLPVVPTAWPPVAGPTRKRRRGLLFFRGGRRRSR